MVKLEHGRTEQTLFRSQTFLASANILIARRRTRNWKRGSTSRGGLTYHTRFLREVANPVPQIDVTWDLAEVKRSLQFIADHAAEADSKSASAAARSFCGQGRRNAPLLSRESVAHDKSEGKE